MTKALAIGIATMTIQLASVHVGSAAQGDAQAFMTGLGLPPVIDHHLDSISANAQVTTANRHVAAATNAANGHVLVRAFATATIPYESFSSQGSGSWTDTIVLLPENSALLGMQVMVRFSTPGVSSSCNSLCFSANGTATAAPSIAATIVVDFGTTVASGSVSYSCDTPPIVHQQVPVPVTAVLGIPFAIEVTGVASAFAQIGSPINPPSWALASCDAQVAFTGLASVTDLVGNPVAGISAILGSTGTDVTNGVNLAPRCSDLFDNDVDGMIDFPGDQSCISPDDQSESSECNDGIDNDDDGSIDFPIDSDCAEPGTLIEAPEPTIILGVASGLVFFSAAGRRRLKLRAAT